MSPARALAQDVQAGGERSTCVARSQPQIDHMQAQRLLDVAVDRFARIGFTATTLRDVAADAGTGLAEALSHFPTKQALLAEIVETTYAAVVAQVGTSVAAAPDDPAARLDAAVWSLCEFCTRHPHSATIAETELHQLEAAHLERALRRRRRLGEIFDDLLLDGVARGAFVIGDPAVVSRSLLRMCVLVATWYEADGPEAQRQVAETYCSLAARMAGVVEPR